MLLIDGGGIALCLTTGSVNVIPEAPNDFDHLIYEIGRATAAAAAVEDYFGLLAVHATGERKWAGAYLRELKTPLERGLSGWSHETEVLALYKRAFDRNEERNGVVHSVWMSFPRLQYTSLESQFLGFRMRKGKPDQVFGLRKSAQQVQELADELERAHAEARALIPMPLPGDEDHLDG
ncbi:hypothetical protein ACI784_09245 [Geodermatophilus sp. SYSU D01186]